MTQKVSSAIINSINAAKLTGTLPANFTEIEKSATDPVADTNPAGGVGTVWANTTTGEMYSCTDATTGANVWTNIGGGTGNVVPSYNIDYLVIAGGGSGFGISGGGSGWYGGGGGAGGYRSSWNSETSGGGGSSETAISKSAGDAQLTITIGAGGAGGNPTGGGYITTNPGVASVFATITTVGGGAVAGNYKSPDMTGYEGGSGGGGAAGSNGAAGTANQGYAGGAGAGVYGGGGGGAGETGNTNGNGQGGDGQASTISASSVVRAGGGGGGSSDTNLGGDGGGGNGSTSSATNAAVNTGGGGGGNKNQGVGGSGGSGVVILRMPTSGYSGTTTGSPTVSTSGSDTILTYISSGTYNP